MIWNSPWQDLMATLMTLAGAIAWLRLWDAIARENLDHLSPQSQNYSHHHGATLCLMLATL